MSEWESIKLNHINKEVNRAKFSPTGKFVVSAELGNQAVVWKSNSGEKVATLNGNNNNFRDATFTPDEKIILTAADENVLIWDANSFEQIAIFDNHSNIVTNCITTKDGNLAATTSDDGTVRVWETRTGRQQHIFNFGRGRTRNVSFSQDENNLLVQIDGRRFFTWSLLSNTVRDFHFQDASVQSVNYSPDGNRIVAAYTDRTARVWDFQRRRQYPDMKAETPGIRFAEYSSDNERILTMSKNRLALWDAFTLRRAKTRWSKKEEFRKAKISPDRSIVAAGTMQGEIVIWDTVGRKNNKILIGHNNFILDLNFSPNGQQIVSTAHDRTAIIWTKV